MRRKISATTALCGLVIGTLPALAWAATEPLLPVPPLPTGPQAPAAPGQPLLRGQTVVERPRPEVEPLGMRLGGFFLFPRFELDEIYNDNILATESSTTSDFITVLAPSFDLLSNFSRHAINLKAGAAIGRYISHSSEDYNDAFASADGRFDFSGSHHLYGGLKVERLHEDRTAPDAPGNAAEPVKFNAYTANIGVSQTDLRIGWQADAAVRREEYEAVPSIGGGLLPQSDRNANIYQGSLRGSYEFVPNYQGFVRAAVNLRDFDHGTPSRDSTGYRIDAGARIDLTGITFAEVFAGYLSQNYNSGSFGSISGVDFGGRLVWNATQLTSVTLKAERTVQDANNEAQGTNSPGYLHSIGGISVDHELLRDLLLNANANYANDDFEGIDRSDNVYDVGVGAKYLLNRHLYLGLSYEYSHRASSGLAATNDYTRNLILLRISTQL